MVEYEYEYAFEPRIVRLPESQGIYRDELPPPRRSSPSEPRCLIRIRYTEPITIYKIPVLEGKRPPVDWRRLLDRLKKPEDP